MGVCKNEVGQLHRPQKRPYGVKGTSRRVKNGHNFLLKIGIKLNISQNNGKKIRTCTSEDFLGSKFMIPKILGSDEISIPRCVFLKFWSCGSKNIQKFQIFKNPQKTSFFNICWFFLAFWANWAKLSTFAQFCLPEISAGLRGSPWKF